MRKKLISKSGFGQCVSDRVAICRQGSVSASLQRELLTLAGQSSDMEVRALLEAFPILHSLLFQASLILYIMGACVSFTGLQCNEIVIK